MQFHFPAQRFSRLFWFTALIFIAADWFAAGPQNWPLKIVPILLAIVWVSTSLGTAGRAVVAGLVFSGCGDVILETVPEQGFVFGLAAFFCAHLCYLYALYPWRKLTAKRHFVMTLPYLLFSAAVLGLIAANLGQLWLPVCLYVLVLVALGWASQSSTLTNPWLVVGAASFILSDSMIALNKFYSPFALSDFAVMTTYYAAQFALSYGFVRSGKDYKVAS